MNYDETRDKMAGIRARTNAEIDTIRSNQHKYSPRGRDMAMAAALSRARAEATALRTAHVKQREDSRASLERSLFGLPSSASATDRLLWRDAQDRADSIGSAEDADRLMTRARLGNDDTMVRAIAQKAMSKGWNEVVDSFVDTAREAPEVAGINEALLQKLTELPQGRNTNIADVAAFAVPAPPELRGLSNRDVDKLAAEEMAEP